MIITFITLGEEVGRGVEKNKIARLFRSLNYVDSANSFQKLTFNDLFCSFESFWK